MQLYIVVYHLVGGAGGPFFLVVDRVPIDLELGISTDFTERRTYSGMLNISQFDMSFRLSGQCAEGYTGPWCNVLCSEVEGPADDTQNNCPLGMVEQSESHNPPLEAPKQCAEASPRDLQITG